MQPNHLSYWMQALKPHLAALGAAFGALAGAGLFYALPFDPFWGWGLVAVGIGILGFGITGRREVAALFVSLGAAGLAFALAGLQVARVETVDFAAGHKPHWIVGRVVEIAEKPENPARVTLRLDRIEAYGLGDGAIAGAGIGVYRSQVQDLKVGDDVALPVVLMAPEGAVTPGGKDMRLWRYFDGGKIYGYVLGTAEPTWRAEAVVGRFGRVQAWIEGLRAVIYAKTAGMAQGAVAALLMGEEKGIPQNVRDAYRTTGLSHLLALSGMQVTLVAGGIYGLLRWLGALVPLIALRVNTRLWAAVVALGGTLFYTLLAGASVSLVRASIMASVVMLAVITGRLRQALRGWCAAVVLVILISPVMVTRAGFELSIAAVFGLILLAMGESRIAGLQGYRIIAKNRLVLWGWELVLATVVAGCATAPVLVVIFGQFNVVGLVANLVAVPVMTVATYLGMIALLVWPLGLEGPVLWLMNVVVQWVNNWAVWWSHVEFATVVVDKGLWWVVAGFSALVIGAILLRRWAEAAVGLISMTAIMLVVAWTAPTAEVMIWEDGKVGLVQVGTGRVPEYRLLWAENVKDAVLMAKGAGVRLESLEGQQIPKEIDERMMPVTSLEHFAWAEKVRGQWTVAPVDCGRVWERMAEACWED